MMQHRSAYHSDDAHWSQRAARKRLSGGSAQKLETLGGLGGCWCGLPFGHPGEDPHPRPADHDEPTPKQMVVAAKLALQEAGVCPVCYGDRLRTCVTCLSTGLFPREAAEEQHRKDLHAQVEKLRSTDDAAEP